MPGSNYKEINKKVNSVYSSLQKRTRRQPYIRSAYFLKKKVFLNIFWRHLFDKTYTVRASRLKLLPAAIDLVQKSRNHPITIDNQNNKSESLHRFYGITKDKIKFIVQVKQIKRNGKLYLMSIYAE